MTKQTSHYNKLVTAFLVFTVVMVTVTTAVTGFWFRRLTIRSVADRAQERLLSVQELLERATLGSYELLVLDVLKSTLYPQFDTPLNTVVFGGTVSPTAIRSIAGDLAVSLRSRPETSNLTLVFSERDFIIDSRAYYSRLARSPDSEMVAVLDSIRLRRWYRRSAPDATYQPHEVLTYVSPIPYYVGAEQAVGYLYVDVRVSELARRLAELADDATEISVLQPDGEPLLNTGGDLVDHRRFAERLARSEARYLADGDIVASVASGAGKYGYTYVSTVASPVFFRQVRTIVLVVATVAVASVLLGVLLSIALARRFALPLQQLMGTLEELGLPEVPSPVGDEYHVMDHFVRALSRRLETLSQRLAHRELFELIVLGRAPETDLSVTDSENSAHVAVALTRPEYGGPVGPALDGCAVTVFPVSDRELLWLIEGQANVDVVIPPMAGLAVGLAGPARTAGELRQLYDYARMAARHAAATSADFGGRTVRYPEIADLPPVEPVDTTFLFTELVARRTKVVIELVAEIGSRAAGGGVDLSSVELELSRTAYTIIEAAQRSGILRQLPDLSATIHRHLEVGRLDRAIRLLVRAIESYADLAVQDSAHARTAGRVCAYIDEHLGEPLSLDQLADMVSLSPSYLSRLFKEEVGETFVEYVGRRRMETAARMLSEDENLVLKDVASRVGYSNVQYFITRFRKRYGVSPARYRSAAARAVH